jgi:uncharacterized membrane protein
MDSTIFHAMKNLQMDIGGYLLQHLLDEPFTQREKLETSHRENLAVHFSLDLVICLIISCAALCFNLYHLGAPNIWFDEALSIERARQSLPVLWKIIFTTQENMALYYLILHYWFSLTSLFGWLPTEFVVRFPSAIFATLSAVVIYLFGKRFMGRIVGLVSAGLYVINALQLTYAQQTRSYSLQLLLVCCSWYALLAALTAKEQKRWWVCYAIVTALAIYTQLFSVFIILAQIITYCCLAVLSTSCKKYIRHRYLPFIVSLVSILIVTLPLLVASRHADRTNWLPAPQLSDIIHFLTSLAGENKVYLLVVGLACALSVLSIFFNRINRDKLLVTLAMLCWFVIPLVVSYAVSLESIRLFSTRYLVIIVPPVLYLAALGIETVSQRHIRSSLVAVLLVMATFSVPFYYQNAQVEDWKQATFWLQSHSQIHDGITCYNNAQGCQLDIEYYLRAYPQNGVVFPADSPGSFPWVSYDLTNQIETDPALAVNPTALAAYGKQHPRIFFVIARLSGQDSAVRAAKAQNWLDGHYRLVDQIVTRTVRIRLYQTTPSAQ